MKLSYAVTTHNEYKEIAKLIPFLLNNMSMEDELVIIDDHSDYKTWRVFDTYIHNDAYNIKFFERSLHNDFAAHKNFMNEQCTGEYIFNIDADEIPHENLITNIKPLIEANPTVDLFWVPRVNTVDGLTDEHAKQWHWRVDEKGWVNWPDPQQRIYRNAKHVKWERSVHERLMGAKVDTALPFTEEWSLYHHKNIDKQEKQNELYGKIIRS